MKWPISLLCLCVLSGFATACQNSSEIEPTVSTTMALRAQEGSLLFSTYIGGSDGDESIRDLAIDSQGNLYVTGGTNSSRFPVTDGSYDETHNGSSDVFVMKFRPTGTLEWATYLGGPHYDLAYAIEIDGQGYVYIGGRAGRGFPVTRGSFQPAMQGGSSNSPYGSQDGFVAKLSSDGKTLLWASYFGAVDDASHPVRDLAIGEQGDVLVASSSSTGKFPPTILQAFQRGARSTRLGGRDSVVAMISSDGAIVKWATYLGGSKEEWGEGTIRADSKGNIFFLTVTESEDAPTTDGAYDSSYNGKGDFYVVCLGPEGRLIFGTYLGGSEMELVETHQLEIDAGGNPIVAAGTLSRDFPTTFGAFQPSYGGSGTKGFGQGTNYPGDVVVAKLSSDGSLLQASTFLGGRFGESAEGVGIDRTGNVYMTGVTFSDNFPTLSHGFQRQRGGHADAFVVKLSPDFSQLLYGTYIGEEEGDSFRAGIVGLENEFYGGGMSFSKNWPVFQGFQPYFSGGKSDAVLVKFNLVH